MILLLWMKKTRTLVLFPFLLSILLTSCFSVPSSTETTSVSSSSTEPITLEYLELDVSTNQWKIDVLIESPVVTLSILRSAGHNIANDVYEKNFSLIGFQTISLTISMYSSRTYYSFHNPDYGTVIYLIDHVNSPIGLRMEDDKLIE